jgi:hypothetical protein
MTPPNVHGESVDWAANAQTVTCRATKNFDDIN